MKHLIRFFALALLSLFLFSLPGLAAKHAAHTRIKNWPEVKYAAPDWLSADTMSSVKQLIHKLDQRNPANTRDLVSTGRHSLDELRTQFFAIHTADQLAAALKPYCSDANADANYSALKPDAKYVVAQLCLLQPFRGIVQKLVPLFVPYRVTRAFAIAELTHLTSYTQILLPTPQWTAGYDYLTEPDPSPSQKYPEFHSVSQFQVFMQDQVYNEMYRAVSRLAQLGKTTHSVFYFDKTFFYSLGDFSDQILQENNFRYRPIGPAEIAGVITSLEVGMHNVLMFSAYNRDDYFRLQDALFDSYVSAGARSAVRTGFGQSVLFMNDVNDKIKVGIVKRYPRYMTLNGDRGVNGHSDQGWYGRQCIALAHNILRNAAIYLEAAWTSTKRQQTPYALSIVRPLLSPQWSPITDYEVHLFQDMVNGPVRLTSMITPSDAVTLNLPEFYKNPVFDLKDLLPTGFYDERDNQHPTSTLNGKIYNNYRYDTPKAWNTAKYSPWLNLGSTKDVGGAIRTLAQSWGGIPVAIPLFKVIQ